MADTKKKSEVRESKPLAESPKYDMDPKTLAESLKKIQSDSNERRAAAYAARESARNKRRSTMDSKGKQSGGSLQGLNTSLGGKIVR